MKIAGWLEELSSPELSTKQLLIKQEIGGFKLKIDVGTDARALHEILVNPMEPRPADSSSLLWLKWLRECHQNGLLRRKIWVSTGDMFADGLTKDADNLSKNIRNLFRSGKIQTKYAIIVGQVVRDGWKGRPPTKKEKEEQGYEGTYHLVESLLETFFLNGTPLPPEGGKE